MDKKPAEDGFPSVGEFIPTPQGEAVVLWREGRLYRALLPSGKVRWYKLRTSDDPPRISWWKRFFNFNLRG